MRNEFFVLLPIHPIVQFLLLFVVVILRDLYVKCARESFLEPVGRDVFIMTLLCLWRSVCDVILIMGMGTM